MDNGGCQLLADFKFEKIIERYKNMRMLFISFEYLINSIGLAISKENTYMRKAISVQERLSIT